MNNELKCPFCEYELQENRTTNLYCPICGLVAPTKLWQALIQSQQDLEESQQATLTNAHTALEFQKDLEIARKALEFYADSRFGKKQDDGTYALEIDKGCGVTVVYTYDPRPAKKALEQIEHKE